MNYALGIDMGGTNIKAIAVSETGEVLTKATRPTIDSETSIGAMPSWAADIKQLVNEIRLELATDATYIGACAPGLAAPDGRSIAFMPGRLTGLEGFDWSRLLDHDVPVLEDAKAALLGEVWQGAAVGCTNAIMLTLGTGVGGAIYSDGRLLMGQIGRAGNLGHVSLNVDLPGDVTGMPGSLENAIGECTVKQRSEGKFESTKDLADAAAKGDLFAQTVWDRSIYQLACAIASFINIVDPERILIGGGIAQAGERLFAPLNKHLEKIEWRPNGYRAQIVPASLGKWAGSIGAAYNALRVPETR